MDSVCLAITSYDYYFWLKCLQHQDTIVELLKTPLVCKTSPKTPNVNELSIVKVIVTKTQFDFLKICFQNRDAIDEFFAKEEEKHREELNIEIQELKNYFEECKQFVEE